MAVAHSLHPPCHSPLPPTRSWSPTLSSKRYFKTVFAPRVSRSTCEAKANAVCFRSGSGWAGTRWRSAVPWRRRTTTWPRRRNSRWRTTAARCTGGCSCTGWWTPSWWVAGPTAGTRDRESRRGVHEGGYAFRKTEDFVRLRRQQRQWARVVGLALTHS